MFLTLDPSISSKRKAPNGENLVDISTGMLSTLPSVHVNFSSSGRVGLVPGHGSSKQTSVKHKTENFFPVNKD